MSSTTILYYTYSQSKIISNFNISAIILDLCPRYVVEDNEYGNFGRDLFYLNKKTCHV